MTTKFLLAAFLLAACSRNSGAQTFPLFNTSEYIDVGNIRAAHLVHGDMWWDPATSDPHCEFPKGSGKHIGFMSSLWMGAYDSRNQLNFAAQIYRMEGKTDYWPGPLESPLLFVTNQSWAKI